MRLTSGWASLQVHPTRRCNLACRHCYSDSGPTARDEVPYPVLRLLLDDAAQRGYEVLAVSGGEPLLYRHLPDLLHAAAGLGLRTTLTSNGMLAGRRRLDPLTGALDLLVLSLDGPPAEHDRMRARDGAWDAMLRRLDDVRASGIPFGFLFTLTQHNVHHLEWAADLAVAQGAALLQVHPLEPSGRGLALRSAVPDALEMSFALLETTRLRRRHGDRLRLQLDLVTTDGLRVALERLAAPTEAAADRLADVLAPLVVEPDGHCGPLQYGFPRRFGLGSLHDDRLPALAQRWVSDVRPRLCAVARLVARRLEGADPRTANVYALLADAAVAPTPSGSSPERPRAARVAP